MLHTGPVSSSVSSELAELCLELWQDTCCRNNSQNNIVAERAMGNPRENVKDQGFWDGGAAAHGKDSETAGRPSGFPGSRKRVRAGIRTDLEFPAAADEKATDERK